MRSYWIFNQRGVCSKSPYRVGRTGTRVEHNNTEPMPTPAISSGPEQHPCSGVLRNTMKARGAQRADEEVQERL